MHATDPVNRIMSEPVLTIAPGDSVRDMLQLFVAYPVHHMPVVENARVVGMLSSADLLKLEFFLPPPGPGRDAVLSERFRVAKVMRTPVVTIAEHETVQRAAELMARNGFHALPVVNAQDHLIGIVTTTDLLHGCLTSAPLAAAGEDQHVAAIDAQLAAAVHAARHAVDGNNDPDGIAAALLRMQHRQSALERVVDAAKRYVNAGQDERLHTMLRKAIDLADAADPKQTRASMLGLDSGA